MSLRNKAADLTFDDLDSDTSATKPPVQASAPAAEETKAAVAPPSPPPAQPPSPRSGVSAVTRSIAMHQQVQELRDKVKFFEEAKVVVLLDPQRIRPSRWKNRDARSFLTQAFYDLKEEIAAAGRNVQAIKVRRVGSDDVGDLYEVVFGHRRHRACTELGLPVAAVIEDLSDTQAYKEMERENRNRADLSPWEQGLMYADALAKGLFPSARSLAQALGVDHSNVAKVVKLANLPQEVIEAFQSPLELQVRWGNDLSATYDEDPERVLNVARELSELPVKLPAKQVFERLMGYASQTSSLSVRELKKDGKKIGSWRRSASGAIKVELKAKGLSAEQEKQLLGLLESFQK